MAKQTNPIVSAQRVRLDLNDEGFQRDLLSLQKHEQVALLKTLRKISSLTWPQVYADQGLKWEKILTVSPPPGIDALYSLRITQGRRATAYRDGPFMRLLTIPPDHDATYKH